jgi:hypothetical protein
MRIKPLRPLRFPERYLTRTPLLGLVMSVELGKLFFDDQLFGGIVGDIYGSYSSQLRCSWGIADIARVSRPFFQSYAAMSLADI